MKLFSAIAAAAVIGASFASANPSKAEEYVSNGRFINTMYATFAGGLCLYNAGKYERESVFARTVEHGKDLGRTPEEVMKVVESPTFGAEVDKTIAMLGGCDKIVDMQLKAWGMK